jgi:AmmeMemoRadiSam system protein A
MCEEPELGDVLLAQARAAIGRELRLAVREPPTHPVLADVGATFVTLRKNGALRGCIGTVQAWRVLGEDVRANAVAAAFHDPRFDRTACDELAAIAIEVSLIGPSEPLRAADEADALAQLMPGVDGVVLICGRRRATFLPQVWEQLAEPRAFMAELKRKAGLPAGYWSADVALARYRVTKFTEPAGVQ